MINTIIILILILIVIIFTIKKENFFNINFNDDIYKDNTSDLDNKLLIDYNIDNEFNCYLYGCNSSRNDMIELIGSDNDNNQIFTDNTNYFKFNNGFLNKIEDIDQLKINKNYNSISIPISNENDKLKLKIKLTYNDYNFIGYVSNNYYHIKYLVYEKPIYTEIDNNKLYEYVIIKIIKKQYKIIYKLPFRSKIENEETIWIDYGPIFLGPLIFTTKLR